MRIPPRLALLVLAGLTVLHTWPLASAPATRSLNYNADTQQWSWTLSWIARAAVRDPLHLFDGNVFAPEPHVLTYSDPVLVPGLIGAPARWLGASPVLTFNLVQLAGLTLTAWAGWFVVWRWTASSAAALVAGALTAFNVHLLTRLPHVPAAHMWGLPLTLYFADRLIDTPSRRDATRLGAVVAAMAATSLYTLTFAAAVIAVVLVASLPRWRSAFAIAAASLAGLIIATPVLWPYAALAVTGATRPLEAVAQFSATPAAYVTSLSWLDAGWTARYFRDDVNVMFAGVAALALAAVGAVAMSRERPARRRLAVLIAIGALGVVLSFGPTTALYRWLYDWALPLRGLRAAARFGYLFLLVIAILAGVGLAWIERRVTPPRRLLVASLALAAVTIEAWPGQIRTDPFKGLPPIYQIVAGTKTPVMLVEVPFWVPDAMFENGEYMLNATAHWKPVMNGYSGAIPDSYRRRADAFWYFPRDWAIDAIEREGATHVMVHLEKVTDTERADIGQALLHRPDLKLLASDAGGHRLYAVSK